jgi:hypothetical protein
MSSSLASVDIVVKRRDLAIHVRYAYRTSRSGKGFLTAFPRWSLERHLRRMEAPANGRWRKPTKEAVMSGQSPKKQFRMSLVVASVFDQETQNGTIHNVSITKLYKADPSDKEWQRGTSLNRDDLPLAIEVAHQAWIWIHEQQQSERAEARKAKGET